jgi:hypothetical protein
VALRADALSDGEQAPGASLEIGFADILIDHSFRVEKRSIERDRVAHDF